MVTVTISLFLSKTNPPLAAEKTPEGLFDAAAIRRVPRVR
jgi:hypothetical protein